MKRLGLGLALLVLAGCQTQQSLPPPVSTLTAVPAQLTSPPQQVTSAGPLTKAAVETYMDAQESDLRSYLRGQGVLVARRGNVLLVTVPSDKLFERSEISAWGGAVLSSVAQVLAHFDHSAVEVSAYTDATGSDEANLAVSQKRAKLVSEALKQAGVAPSRVVANGFGATSPKTNDPRDPRNRRIELKITPTPTG